MRWGYGRLVILELVAGGCGLDGENVSSFLAIFLGSPNIHPGCHDFKPIYGI